MCFAFGIFCVAFLGVFSGYMGIESQKNFEFFVFRTLVSLVLVCYLNCKVDSDMESLYIFRLKNEFLRLNY